MYEYIRKYKITSRHKFSWLPSWSQPMVYSYQTFNQKQFASDSLKATTHRSYVLFAKNVVVSLLLMLLNLLLQVLGNLCKFHSKLMSLLGILIL